MKHLRHVLSVDQFDRAFLDEVCALTTRVRQESKTRKGAIRLQRKFRRQRAMLYFTQPSTRTFMSFLAACQNLGMMTVEVRDPATSSAVKGETELDSIRTFASYADVIIMRSASEGLAEDAAKHLDATPRPVPIVNAGSGANEHPTQALLDIYTLSESFRKWGGIEGKTIALVGDLKRGRTVRSLAKLMRYYPGVRLLLVAPEQFRMRSDVTEYLRANGVVYHETTDFAHAVSDSDAVYMTRIQDEHDAMEGESARVDTSRYCFRPEHLQYLRQRAIVMHPLPRRQELDPACDADSRVMIWRQERNGMWVRTALLLMLLTEDDPLERYLHQK